MAAWQLVNAWSGFNADAVDGTMRFNPKEDGDYRLFWSSGTGWGELIRTGGRLALTVRGGAAPLTHVTVDGRDYPARPLAAGETLELR
jgi:hypothetical protein